jgi:hypothetical protein
MFLPSYLDTVCRLDPGMPLVKTSSVLLAISPWGVWASASAAFAAGGPEQLHQISNLSAQLADSSLQETVILAVRQAVGVIVAGYAKAPLLVTILSALLVLPAVAIAAWMWRGAKRLAQRKASHRPATTDTTTLGSNAGSNVPAWPAQAWLSVEGEAAGARPIAGEMIRIGRHPDNEIWLTDSSVHRYHAVIHRTMDADFFITDLSGQEGNGVRINGTRRAQSPLANGDVIELGKARITFATNSA